MIGVEKIKADPSRGLCGFISYVLIIFGAGCQWGFAASVLSLGLVLFINVTIDEGLERCTRLKRSA